MSDHQESVEALKDGQPPKKPVDPSAFYEGQEDGPLFAPKDLTTSTTSKEMTKNQYNFWRSSQGMILVFTCVSLIFLLSLVSVFPWAQRSEVIPMAIDTLKLITTTVVGFVFGSHTFGSDKDNDDK